MSESLLIIGGGIEAIPGVKLAKEMGLRVIVSDIDPNAPGFKFADATLLASTYDVEATLKAARNYHEKSGPFTGVMCIAADTPHTVAAVAADLALPGIPLDSALITVDKLAMKDCFDSAGVAIPWYSKVESVSHLTAIVAKQGFPLVIKPVDSRGSRGVLLLRSGVDLEWVFSYAVSYSTAKTVMVERYLEGPQISTESLVINGIIRTLGWSDRNYEKLSDTLPHIVEDGGDLPSMHAQGFETTIDQLIGQAAHALNIQNGVIKGDIVISDGKPYIIELAPRLSGGYFCTHEIPLNTGVDFVRQVIKLTMGWPINRNDLKPRFNRPVSQRYLFPEPGVVTAINGVEEVSTRPGIELCEVRVLPGDEISAIHNHPARAGVVIATGSSREDAQARVCAAIKDIKISTSTRQKIHTK